MAADGERECAATLSGSGGFGGPKKNGDGGENVKLFVGQVPKNMTEEQLREMFKEAALVDEVNIIKDKVTKTSRGCCFLICPSRLEAEKAINACHNKRTLCGASSPLQVKYADGELERLEHKLFIGMLPKNVTDDEVTSLFSQYGNVKDLQILRGSQQTSKVCAFLKYETKEQAVAALDALNGKHKMEGSNVPLVVKWADTEKERKARKAQKSQSHTSGVTHSSTIQPPSLFGALPMGYISPFNGFSYQAPGTYRLMQYPLASMESQTRFHDNMILSVNHGNAIRGTNHDAPRNFTSMQLAGYVGRGYPDASDLQYPVAYHGSIASHGHFSNSQPMNGNDFAASFSNNNASSGGQIEGPAGANLFIYHIPQEFGDHELSNAFQGFGKILSAKVFVDKATGASKCFGFVSYDTPEAAQAAIAVMNGFQLGGKKLKVQLKRDNKQIKPY